MRQLPSFVGIEDDPRDKAPRRQSKDTACCTAWRGGRERVRQKGGVDKNYRSNSCLPASSKENNLLSDPPGERTTSAGGSLLTAHLRAVLQTGFGVRDGGETLSAVGRVVHQIALRTFRVTLRSTTERGGALVASTHPFFSC